MQHPGRLEPASCNVADAFVIVHTGLADLTGEIDALYAKVKAKVGWGSG